VEGGAHRTAGISRRRAPQVGGCPHGSAAPGGRTRNSTVSSRGESCEVTGAAATSAKSSKRLIVVTSSGGRLK